MGKIKYSTLSNMESLLTDNLINCIHCGRRAEECHHIFNASDKRYSEEFKLMIPLCHMCHMDLHNDQGMNTYYKTLGQEAFMKKYPDKNWMDYFKKSYL